jgi:site-specific DNA recombinase
MLRKGMVINDSHVYGYDFDKETRSYQANPIEAQNVKEIFRLYLDMRIGVPKLTNWLNAHTEQYPPPNGRTWSISTIHDILRREMYTGKFYSHKIYHARTGLKAEKKIIRPQNEWVEMSCPAIISREVYESAQALMEKNKKYSHKPNHHPYLLQGLAYCGKCGQMLSTRRSGSQNVARYMCWRHSNVTGSHPGCGAKSMLCEPIDEVFWALLEAICKSPEKLEAYVKQSAPDSGEYSHALEEQKRQKKIDKIKAERKSVMLWFSQQLITHEEATERLEALKKTESKLMQENIPVKPKASQMDYRAVCEAVAVCAKNAQVRQNLVRKIVEKVEIARTDDSIGAKNYKLDIRIHFANK